MMTTVRFAFLAIVSAALLSCGTGPEGGSADADEAWQRDIETAMAMAKENGAARLVLVDFHTDWCGWCKKLDRDVFATPLFREKAADAFVLLKVNPEKSASGRALAREHGVEGFPTVLFLDADGGLVRKVAGYLPLDAFLREMDAALDGVS